MYEGDGGEQLLKKLHINIYLYKLLVNTRSFNTGLQ